MRKTKTTEKRKIRVTLDLTEDVYRRLERLEEKIDAESKAHVLRSGLQLLEYVVEKTEQGMEIVAKKRGQPERVCDLLPLVRLNTEPQRPTEDLQDGRRRGVVRLVEAHQT